MSEIINYTRLTTSDKLHDKFITCQAYIPQDKDLSDLGQIFSQIEILSAWFPTSQVGQTIINTLIKEYYRGRDTSELINFEESVKKVNESLAQAAQSGETEWIGKLSGVLVLLNNKELHLAQTGKSQAYLYRGGKINHITEGLESDEAPHPLKTFSNLTSGNLQEDDKVIIANNAFFESISPTELKMIITSLPPTLAAIESAKILQNQGTQDANAIFLEVTTKDKLANLPPDQKIETVYLDQQVLTISAMGKNVLKNFSTSTFQFLKKNSQKVGEFTKSKVKPIAQKSLEVSKEKSKLAFERTRVAAKEKVEDFDKKVEEISAEKGYVGKKNFVSLSGSILLTWFSKCKNKIRRQLIKIGLYSREKSKMYLAMLIGVVVVLGLVVFLSLNSQKSKAQEKQAGDFYNQMISLSGEADILSGKNQTNDAIKKYIQVVDLFEKTKSSKYEKDAKTIYDKVSSKIYQTIKLTDIKPTWTSELKGLSNITLLKDGLYATAGNDLYSFKQSSNSFIKTASIGSEMAKIIGIDELDLFAAISQNKLLSFNSTGNELKENSVNTSQGAKIFSFGSSIYILEAKTNKLTKAGYGSSGFEEFNEYFKEPNNLNNILDIAIDGSLYTLDKSGIITRYSRGNKVSDFEVKLPGEQKIDGFVSLITTENADDMIVLAKVNSNYRALRIGKNGGFIKQYNLQEISAIDNAISTNDLGTLYITSSEKTFAYKLD